MLEWRALRTVRTAMRVAWRLNLPPASYTAARRLPAARPMATCAAGTAHSNASRVATESTGCQRHSCAVKLVEQSYRSTDVAGPRP